MRDYNNMPVLKWQGPISAKKAMAQVHHEEPVIILFPKDINLIVDAQACSCEAEKNTGQLINCNVSSTLKVLAEKMIFLNCLNLPKLHMKQARLLILKLICIESFFMISLRTPSFYS